MSNQFELFETVYSWNVFVILCLSQTDYLHSSLSLHPLNLCVLTVTVYLIAGCSCSL